MTTSGDSKQLKITSIYDSRGADKVKKEAQELIVVYNQLGVAMKNVQTGFILVNNSATQSSTAISRQTVAIKDATRAANDYAETFKKLNAAQSSLMGGSALGGSLRADFRQDLQRLYGNGPPPRGPGGPFGGGPMGWGKAAGMAFGAIGGAIGMYSTYLQHEGRSETHEKLTPVGNLASSQAYRNYMFQESRSAPIGYSAVKAATELRLKGRNSQGITIGPDGRIIQPQGGGQGVLGAEQAGAAQNMHGYDTEHRGSWWQQAQGGLLGFGKMVLGGAAIAASVGGTAATGGLGGALGLAGAGAGIGIIASGLKDVQQAIWGVHSEEKKMKEGGPEAQQNADAVQSQRSVDEILAITRHQMAVFNGLAGMSVAGNRHGLGATGVAFAQTDFDKGEALSIASGARRGYGRAGAVNTKAIFNAARMGMSSDVATEVTGAYGAQGSQQLSHMMALAVKAGFENIDMGFFEKLAGAAGRTAYSGAGGMRSQGAGDVFFGGMRNIDQYNVGERIGGMAAGDRLFTQNSYFHSRGMVDAAQVLGGGAEGSQITALAGASYQDLLNGGSEKLQAMIGTGPRAEAMLASMRKRRVNNLGAVLSKNSAVSSMLGGQDLDTFLQGLSGRLGNKKTAGEAQSQLNTLAAYGSELTGEQFGDLRGMLSGYGISPAAMAKTGAFKKLGGAGLNVTSTQNRMQNEDYYAGIRWTSDVGTAETNLRGLNGKFRSYLQESAGGKRLVEDFEKASGEKKAGLAARINSEFSVFQGRNAADAGNGYDSAQKLNEGMGFMAKRMSPGGDVANAIDNFIKSLRDAASEIGKYNVRRFGATK